MDVIVASTAESNMNKYININALRQMMSEPMRAVRWPSPHGSDAARAGRKSGRLNEIRDVRPVSRLHVP